MSTPLKNRWFDLFDDEDVDNEQVISVYANIISAYTEPHRAYHTLNHLEFMFDKLDNMLQIYMLSDDVDRKALYLATWFHDFIYVTNFPENEEHPVNEIASAEYAVNSLKKIGMCDERLLDTVYHLIIATKHHEPDESLPFDLLLQQILLDADMAILGADSHIYKKYVSQIEFEWSHIPQEKFHQGRSLFLTGMLQKNGIFYTEYMKELYDTQAIQNIKQELSILDKLSVDDLISNL
jgi:predicted metal-dependent HD superfamily phosphohydrolase